MRITNNMMTASSVRNINKNMERLSTAEAKVSTQSKIQQPSDDPIVASNAVRYRSYVAKVEQYQENADYVTSWQKVTDDALGDLSDVMQNLKELVVQASSDTLSDSDLAAIKEDVTQLQQTAIDCLNTSYGGRYVFAGYATDEAPYSLDTSTTVGNRVLFKGQYLSAGGAMDASLSDSDISSFYTTAVGGDMIYDSSTDGTQAIKSNIGYGTSIAVNTEGQTVTGEGMNNLFDTFSKVLLGLDGDTSYKTVDNTGTVTETSFDLDDTLTDIETNYDTIIAGQADLGARMNYVSMVSTRLDNDYTTYKELMSNNEDVNMASASAEVATAETVYEASLSVGVKVMSKSLLDYLA